MSVMILYLGITVIGYFVGAFFRKKGTVLKGVGIIQTIAIMILVFIMGNRIGADETIVRSLDSIGLIAFVLTIFVLIGSVAAVFFTRKFLGFDKKGNLTKRKEKRAEKELLEAEIILEQDMFDINTTESDVGAMTEEDAKKEKVDNTMTIVILVSVTIGILAGYFVMPQWFINISGTLIVVWLCILLIFVGMDIGTEGTIVKNFKQAGWRVIVFPLATIIGTLAAVVLGSLFLPLSIKDALCVGSGFGWYTLAPVMLTEYSVRVSAISFMHNVMRELFSILLIPIIAKKIGYIETTGMPGAAAMDVCLPIVERATRSDIAVYSFISGVALTIAVPVCVAFFMG